MASPIPEPAPVTRAILFSNLNINNLSNCHSSLVGKTSFICACGSARLSSLVETSRRSAFPHGKADFMFGAIFFPVLVGAEGALVQGAEPSPWQRLQRLVGEAHSESLYARRWSRSRCPCGSTDGRDAGVGEAAQVCHGKTHCHMPVLGYRGTRRPLRRAVGIPDRTVQPAPLASFARAVRGSVNPPL